MKKIILCSLLCATSGTAVDTGLVDPKDSAYTVYCKPSQNFTKFLEDCDYAPKCIQYIREKYPADLQEIDALVFSHYINGYRNMIINANSVEEKLRILNSKITFLIAEPHWIDNGWEPYLIGTNDGSDRGGEGLRYKALMIVIDEVTNDSLRSTTAS